MRRRLTLWSAADLCRFGPPSGAGIPLRGCQKAVEGYSTPYGQKANHTRLERGYFKSRARMCSWHLTQLGSSYPVAGNGFSSRQETTRVQLQLNSRCGSRMPLRASGDRGFHFISNCFQGHRLREGTEAIS